MTGCRFSCDPAAPDPACPDGPHPVGAPAGYRPARLVELPLGATEDRVTGSLDVPQVLAGAPTSEAFVPGLLALAHRGILYVDEINLLPDHLVDVLLDAAATGTTVVEREGVSLRHASRFLLVGTMNPEEGELRPQLLDRFGLCVPVIASADPAQRAAAVRARIGYDLHPAVSEAAHEQAGKELTSRIAAAQAKLGRRRPARRRADAHHHGLRVARGGRPAGGPGDRAGRDRARRLARGPGSDRRRRPRGGQAGAAAPASPRSVR